MRKRWLHGCLACLLAAGLGCTGTWCRTKTCQDPQERAGYPRELSKCAKPSDTGKYTMYRVGGGAPCKGDCPGPEDGTWGWDYSGYWFPSKIALRWWNGKPQGGTGGYKTDGPRREHHEREGGGEGGGH